MSKEITEGYGGAGWPERLDRFHSLLVVLDKAGLDEYVLYELMERIAVSQRGVERYEAFLKRLGEEPSPRLQHLAHLYQLQHSVIDADTLEAARQEAHRYIASEHVDPRLIGRFDSAASERARNMAARAARESRAETAPSAGKDVTTSRLTSISDRLTWERPSGARFSGKSFTKAWLTCGPGVEVVVAVDGLYRLESGDRLKLLAPVTQAKPPSNSPGYHGVPDAAYWDGKYIWVLTSRPKEAIVVVDPVGGEVLRFDDDDVLRGGAVWTSRLACIGPGRAVFYGCLRKPPDPSRSWLMLLEAQQEDGRPARKHFESFYENRERLADRRELNDDRLNPAPWWALTVPSEIEPAGPWVMVKTGATTPLIIDAARKQVRPAKAAWPTEPFCLGKRLIVPDGWVCIKGTQKSWLAWSDHPDRPSQTLVDWGERPLETFAGTGGFFSAWVEFQGRLYLLAGCGPDRSPALIAVEPSSLDTRIVIDTFPKDWPRRYSEALGVSERFGLILISSGKAYRVNVPPMDSLPQLTAVPLSRPTR